MIFSAIKVFREIGHPGMVMALEEIKHVEDKNLVSAHFAALFGEYDLAQELFLKCGCPLEALNVNRTFLFSLEEEFAFRCR